MPHIIVEYSEQLTNKFNVSSMFGNLAESIVGMHGCEEDRIKARAYSISEHMCVVGGNPYKPMVHVNLKLMPGRTDEQKKDLSEAMRKSIDFYIESNPECAFTFEVSELHGPSYQP